MHTYFLWGLNQGCKAVIIRFADHNFLVTLVYPIFYVKLIEIIINNHGDQLIIFKG